MTIITKIQANRIYRSNGKIDLFIPGKSLWDTFVNIRHIVGGELELIGMGDKFFIFGRKNCAHLPENLYFPQLLGDVVVIPGGMD